MNILNVNLHNNSYDIVIEKGLFENFRKEIRKVYNGTKIAVITDSNLFDLYHTALEEQLSKENFILNFIVVKPGENSKTMSTLEYVYSNLSSFNITRSDLIIAFGGGVVGDLAGFAASTYLRGISYIQIPTSLLAQIDSSIGGKVAINLKEGKNLAGSFYQPIKVLIDPDILFSLPEKYIKDGLGEVIKYACIKDPILFDTLMSIDSNKQLFNHIEYIIYCCCTIKKQLVEADERDTDLRMLLNFGHTIGHAIEKHLNYEIGHGEAVCAGMLYITKNSQLFKYTEAGTYEAMQNMLEHFHIEYNIPDLTASHIKKYISLDKKNLGREIKLILLKKIGDAFIHKVPFSEVDKFINI
ncbi:MAG: 3-dehydroquinate synthase [Sedimentibacter sp.]